MSHSVEKHLAVTPADYDVEIRRFVPGYDALLEEVIGALREHLPPVPSRVIDLGAGTGALSERITRALPVHMVVLDADAEMLKRAASRLAPVRERIELRHGTFGEPLPRVHAAVASLALHHVHESTDKRDVYRNILTSLREGGVIVNADAMIPAQEALAMPLRRRWAAHLMANGDTEKRAFERFAEWSLEDRYYSVDEEIAMMRDAGFAEVDVRWRVGPMAVVVGRKPG
jgi:tRNA (cmo5U34)-methyltransferase